MTRRTAHVGTLSAACAVTLILVCATSSGAQTSNNPIQEEAISVSVKAAVRTLVYTRRRDDALVLISEAVPIDVGVGNFTAEAVTIGSADQPWASGSSVSVARLDDGTTLDFEREPVLEREGETGPHGPVALEPGARASARFLLRSRNGEPVSPGRYRVTVAIEPGSIEPPSRRARNILTREIVIEVREPQTNEDVMDQHLQRAYRAMTAGRHADSRQWLDRVLALRPTSVIALNELGASFLREGNCGQAVPILTRVLSLLQSDADPDVPSSLRYELTPALRGVLAARCPP